MFSFVVLLDLGSITWERTLENNTMIVKTHQFDGEHTSERGYELNFRLRCKNDGGMVSSALFKNSRAYHTTIILRIPPG
jgi:hypothetical protein